MSGRKRASGLCLLALVLSWSGFAIADPGDKAGWSTMTDPRQRAFLMFVPEKDGPRILMFGCLRDVDSFAVYSTGLDLRAAANAELSLVNGTASYRVRGEIAPDGLSPEPTFSYEDFDADRAALQRIKTALMPVFKEPGPVKLTVGTASRELPLTGLKPALDRFSAICFGR